MQREEEAQATGTVEEKEDEGAGKLIMKPAVEMRGDNEEEEGKDRMTREKDGGEIVCEREKAGEKESRKKDQGRKMPCKGADLIVEEQEAPGPAFQPDGMYYAVKQVLKGGVDGYPLNKKFKDEACPDRGFLQDGDERWGRNYNQFKLSKPRIVSCSIDTSRGTCKTCLSGEHEAWSSGEGGPVVVVLSDQHFPANVPADGPGECLRIIRVENGTLNELTDELVRKAPKEGLPSGSVILLLSASQLYYESVEHYAAEWSRCRNWLRADLGEVLVLPGLPLTGNGINSETAVRGLLDFYAWIGRLEEPEMKLIRNTRLAWTDAYRQSF